MSCCPAESPCVGSMKRCRWVCVALAVALCVLAPPRAWAQRQLTQIPPPDPELERQALELADGFEINLFAADPRIAKPIHMNFDAQGRLWIASSEIYPHILPGQVANDKILVLEDADGDGRAENTTVFAEGLLIPTGVEPGDGGAYVANSTELLHLRDRDGDGRADERRVVLSGFGTEDTHHILHTLRWGPDGMLYMNQSIYIHSHIETPYGPRRLGGGGVWQFRPETMRLEVFVRGLCNPWGHHFDRFGQSFGTDGAGGEGINYFLPGAYYFTAPGAARILPGLNPGSPKHCGLEVVSGRHLPDDWQGTLVTNDFRANRVCRFRLREEGAGFASQEMPELIRSTHVGFRPVDVKMGPDGAIYIADWYNPIIQHGEVDFRDPRRDHTHGRIWRVTARGRALVPRPRLVEAPEPVLLEALREPEDWTRHFAKRVLKERGAAAVLPYLAPWLHTLEADDEATWHLQLEGLWVYQSLDVVEPELLGRLLAAPDARIRAAATRVLTAWHARLPQAAEWLAQRVADEHPRVRLEAARGLAALGDAHACDVALTALGTPRDRFLDYALWLTARETAPAWLPQVETGEIDFGGSAERQLFALEAAAVPAVVPHVMRLLETNRLDPGQLDRAVALVAATGGADELGAVFRWTLDHRLGEPANCQQLLASLRRAARARNLVPAGDLSRLADALTVSHEPLAAEAARAIGAWHVEPLGELLTQRALQPETPAQLRLAAIEGLSGLAGEKSIATLVDLASGNWPPEVREQAVVGLLPLEPPRAAELAVAVLAHPTLHRDPGAICRAFLAQKKGPATLAAALSGKQLAPDVAKLALRVVRATGQEHAELVAAFRAAGGIAGGITQLSPDELATLVRAVGEQGDPQRGEAIFRRADQACLKCHAIAGAGGRVGPDLLSIGASAPVDYLIESILLPNKAVKENYHALSVATQDGKITSGIPVREDDSELVLRTAEDAEATVAKSQIEERAPAASLMPAGLVDDLTQQELVDLVRFLSALGKPGPYAVGQARLVRRWEALTPAPDTMQALRRTGLEVAAQAHDRFAWQPAYSRVAGSLPLAGLPTFRLAGERSPHTVVRCRLEVSTAGPVRIRLGSATGLVLWVDGQAVPPAEELTLDLAAGPHILCLAARTDERQEDLRCEVLDLPNSPAQVQLVAGP